MRKYKAALASLILPGAGQFYNKENRKAVFFFAIGVLSFLNWGLFIVVRIIAAYEAYTVENRIETGETEPKEKYEDVKEEAEPAEAPIDAEAPVVAPAEPKEDILLKTLLDITTEDRYYQFDEIRTGMEARYGTPQNWLTNAWVGKSLGPLGFTDKRRVAAGTEVKLTASEVLNIARKKGLFG